jgi:hypothetical protein
MNDDIGVVDWFTKKRQKYSYSGESDGELDRIVEDLQKAFQAKDLNGAADAVYRILYESPFFSGICSDTRLPVCSLFHHSKNTAGIAACLAIDYLRESPDSGRKMLQEYGLSDDTIARYTVRDIVGLIRLGALLHDIGKPRTYTKERKGWNFQVHVTQTEEIVTALIRYATSPLVDRFDLSRVLPLLAARHHRDKATTTAEQIIHKADMVSSAADRMYEVSGTVSGDRMTVHSDDALFLHEISMASGDYTCPEQRNAELIGYHSDLSHRVEIKTGFDAQRSPPQLFRDEVVSGGPVVYRGTCTPHSGKIGYLAMDIMRIQAYIREADKLPMLRGGSRIIENILEESAGYIADKVCPEAVLFRGGGNLLALVPVSEEIREDLKRSIQGIVKRVSEDAVRAAIVTGTTDIDTLAGHFGDIIHTAQEALDAAKQAPHQERIIKAVSRSSLCTACCTREIKGTLTTRAGSEDLCLQCARKRESGRDSRDELLLPLDLMQQNHIFTPVDLQHIGNSIAVIAIDGNMMGRMFHKTLTPADYTYKSETFDRRFKDVIRQTIREFVVVDLRENSLKDSVVRHVACDLSGNQRTFLGIFPLYVGGDDLLLIMNARGAIPFCKKLVENVSAGFRFEHSFTGGIKVSNPTVTISCGVAIADAKFPVYFLLDAARRMEGKAKEKFRGQVETNEYHLLDLPDGAIAFTAITSAMPGNDATVFVIGDKPGCLDDMRELDLIINLIHKSLKGTEATQRMISSVMTCGQTEMERLNMLKLQYSSTMRKERVKPLEWLDTCDELASVLVNRKVMDATRMVIPFVWSATEESS